MQSLKTSLSGLFVMKKGKSYHDVGFACPRQNRREGNRRGELLCQFWKGSVTMQVIVAAAYKWVTSGLVEARVQLVTDHQQGIELN